jgi:hypothetical protein
VNPPGMIHILSQHIFQETFKGINWIGNYIVTDSDETLIYLYKSKSGKVVNVLERYQNHVNVIFFHREKKILAISGIDSFTKLWGPTKLTGIDYKAIQQSIEINLS